MPYNLQFFLDKKALEKTGKQLLIVGSLFFNPALNCTFF
jgi:hypothetical protein